MASNDMADFEAKLKQFQDRAKTKAVKQVKRICLKVFQNIVQQTPVLTGCARGNWRINFGDSPIRTFVSSAKDPGGNQTLSAGSAQIMGNTNLGVRVNICNSCPYIMRLEHGYSRQAPSGMVHITVEAIASAMGLAVQW